MEGLESLRCPSVWFPKKKTLLAAALRSTALVSRSLGGRTERWRWREGVHEPERPHGAAAIKRKTPRPSKRCGFGGKSLRQRWEEPGGRGRVGGGVWTGAASAPFSQTNGGETNAIGDKRGETQKYRELHPDEHLAVRGDLPPPAHPDEIIPSPNCNQSSEKHSGAAAHSAINSPGPGVLLFKYYNPFNVLPACLFLLH